MQQKGQYEESRGKVVCKSMAWTIVKQALFGMSVFQIVAKGQQQKQHYFLFELQTFLKTVHCISNGVLRPAFSSVLPFLSPAWLKDKEVEFLSGGGEIQG